MQTVTITPRYVDPPKDGKKYGSIKDDAGNRYAAPPHITQQVQPGVPVTIGWEPQTWGGSPVMVVRQVSAGAAPQPAPAPVGHNQPPAPQPRDPKERGMFIMGVVGRAMGSGQFSPTDIQNLALAADEAWTALERRWAGGLNDALPM